MTWKSWRLKPLPALHADGKYRAQRGGTSGGTDLSRKTRKLLLGNGLLIGHSTPAASTITRFARSGLGAVVRRRAPPFGLARALDSRRLHQSSIAVHRRPCDPWTSALPGRKLRAHRRITVVPHCCKLPHLASTKARGYSWGYFPIWGYRCPGGIDTLVRRVASFLTISA